MYFNDCDRAAKQLIEHIGKSIVIAVPLALGKPIGILNALYKLAKADPTIQLTIVTGLTLSRPAPKSDLEKRFAQPIIDRILGNFEDPLYEQPRITQTLPVNISVKEFFLSPGKYLQNATVQQNYICSKYTSAVRDLSFYGVNVIAQMVASAEEDQAHYSLSSNSDLFMAAVEEVKASGRHPTAIIAEINTQLPFMLGDALIPATTFTHIINPKIHRTLFALPRAELGAEDLLIGLYASCLIKDDSCLQIGIGKLGCAVARALIVRQKQQSYYQSLLNHFQVGKKFGAELKIGESDLFTKGLTASTEMFSDEYIDLYHAGILKKRVYDHVILQRLLNQGVIEEKISPNILNLLLAHRAIHNPLTEHDVNFLKQFGIFKSTVRYSQGQLILSHDEKISADFTQNEATIIAHCLGEQLESGKILYGGFFLGSGVFYEALRTLTPRERQLIDMTTIARTNTLDADPELFRLQRENARFINSAMMVTLNGSIVSDGLKNNLEVSGVGGQFDFIYMAHEMGNARAIIVCRSTRRNHDIESNIVWEYENITIPRYLRDIVITEYGIADLRSKTDSDIIKTILNITDSRFQPQLLRKAKHYGKIEASYEIPTEFSHNTPTAIKHLKAQLQDRDYFKPYPFGTELTTEELALKPALTYLKQCRVIKILVLFLLSFFTKMPAEAKPYLERLQLLHPKNLKEFFYKQLVIMALRHCHPR